MSIMCQTFLNIDSLQYFKFQAEPSLLTSQKIAFLWIRKLLSFLMERFIAKNTEVLVSPHKRHLNHPLKKINLIYILPFLSMETN